MKFWCADYELTPLRRLNAQTSLNARAGFLLKVEWSSNLVGYSDVFPWPEFGDPSIDTLKNQIHQRKAVHGLLASSMILNREDAQTRRTQRSLFQSLVMPKCHALLNVDEPLSDLVEKRALGFSIFKLKMGYGVDAEDVGLKLEAHEKLRLDFNGSLTGRQFEEFWKELPAQVKSKIDMMEDPFRDEGSVENLPLASDFIRNPNWPITIFKPARDLFSLVPNFQRVIFTHSLDHPIGQAFALWMAARFQRESPQRKEVHGVNPSHPYEDNEFSSLWRTSGATPQPPKGLGVGFDKILRDQSWQSL